MKPIQNQLDAPASRAGIEANSVLWWGPEQGALGWLKDRIETHCSDGSYDGELAVLRHSDDFNEVYQYARQGLRRLIVACESRWDYPILELNQFAAEFPDIPTALAMSDWWLGWRRTGIGHLNALPHVCLPWFRLWDGWVQWLDGSSQSMLEPIPANRPLDLNGGNALRSTIAQRTPRTHEADGEVPWGLVIGSCPSTIHGWTKALHGIGNIEIGLESIEEILHRASSGHATPPRWILWDDSRIPTSHRATVGAFELNEGIRFSTNIALNEISAIATMHPSTTIWLGWTQPIWSELRPILESGHRVELLAKNA